MPSHVHDVDAPSPWVCRWAGLIRPGGRVLDVACGHGRHVRYLKSRSFAVVGVDRDEAALGALRELGGIELHVADIEGMPWPFPPGEFDGVVVANYLHRPLFPNLVGALRPGGVLIYETFAIGNERYGRPSNPAFLLRPGELLHSLEPLAVVAFEEGLVSAPKRAVVQRVCAIQRNAGVAAIDSLPASQAG